MDKASWFIMKLGLLSEVAIDVVSLRQSPALVSFPTKILQEYMGAYSITVDTRYRYFITSNNGKTGVNVVALVNRF